MKFLKWCVMSAVLCLLSVGVYAQTDRATLVSDDWRVERRCLAEPLEKPSDWTFDGEILLNGWGGVHGVNQDTDTPYVIEWGDDRLMSPDAEWVLERPNTNFTFRAVTARRLEDGFSETFERRINLQDTAIPFPILSDVWLDNDSFLMLADDRETRLVKVDNAEVLGWQGVPLQYYHFDVSPDATRVVTEAGLFKLETNELLNGDLGMFNNNYAALWLPDSSGFAHFTSVADDGRNFLMALYDRDGNIISVPHELYWGGDRNFLAWSADGRYLMFQGFIAETADRGTYLLDREEQVIYDLCYINTVVSAVASPSGYTFAFLSNQDQSPIMLFDVDTLQPYIIAYHFGQVFDWNN
jgi:hypothetical protein